MALQPAPAAHTQITEVIIYNQRDQKKKKKNLLTLQCLVQWEISFPFSQVQ